MKVVCTIVHDSTYSKEGYQVACTTAHCNRCGHETESYGDGPASDRRCLVILREECPQEENNLYVERTGPTAPRCRPQRPVGDGEFPW
jgi:hypothetical protein